MSVRAAQLLIVLSCCVSGCAIFSPAVDQFTQKPRPLTADQTASFERQGPIRRVVRMETSVATALPTDRRLRRLVWDELDEVGVLSPEDRRRLNQSGIRVGVCGGNLSWTLAGLLRGERGESGRSAALSLDTNTTSAIGSHLVIAEGSRSMLQLPSDDDGLLIPPDEIAGLKRGAELPSGRLILAMEAVEYGPGWVVMRFLPQIHYGSFTTRLSGAPGQQRMPVRQGIQPLYAQQFELKLHAGETIVIGHEESDDWTVGRLLFRSGALSGERERLVALQLMEIEEVVGERSVNVEYGRY